MAIPRAAAPLHYGNEQEGCTTKVIRTDTKHTLKPSAFHSDSRHQTMLAEPPTVHKRMSTRNTPGARRHRPPTRPPHIGGDSLSPPHHTPHSVGRRRDSAPAPPRSARPRHSHDSRSGRAPAASPCASSSARAADTVGCVELRGRPADGVGRADPDEEAQGEAAGDEGRGEGVGQGSRSLPVQRDGAGGWAVDRRDRRSAAGW